MKSNSVSKAAAKQSSLQKLYRSIWLFPVVLLIPLVLFAVFRISGSSVGMFHTMLYGQTKDPDLVFGKTRFIRSDEWLVTTQQTIVQAKSNYPLVNENIGEGQNMSITDVPYKEWSTLFKPHNLAFFVLPLENAFALKWWLMGYLLMVSCYFFILTMLPKKRLLAAGLSSALFLSAFVQWWYVYGTLASLYYPLFIGTTTLYLWRAKELKKKILLGALLAYLVACFALVLYPPFQIATGLVMAAFLLGYLIQNFKQWDKPAVLQNLSIMVVAIIISASIVGLFIVTRLDVIKTTNDTVYPGKRSSQSGGFFPKHFMSSHLGALFLSSSKTESYLIDDISASNQSETSNFLLVIPFLLLPSIYLLAYQKAKKQATDWPLLLTSSLFVIFLLQLFVPAFTPFSKLLILNKVGDARLLIGVGLLNLVVMVLWIRNYAREKFIFPQWSAIIYSLLVFACGLALALHAHYDFVRFISLRGAIILSVPIPLVMYFLLRKKFSAAVIVYLAFSVATGFLVNPFYQGLGVVTNNNLSKAIAKEGATSDRTWVSEGGYLENMPALNGERSLSGIYNYPQFDLWDDIPGVNEADYNRYAHVGVQVSNDTTTPTKLKLITADSFVVQTNACSDYLKSLNVGHILTPVVLDNNCVRLEEKISFPNTVLYIYELTSSK